MLQVLWLSALAIGATAVIWKGSELLESSSQELSTYYGLPPIVHGAIVVAIGSSFPELSSAVLATLLHGEFELGVGAIVGSAIFNILVIPAIAGLMSSGALDANRDVVYKEAQFYMLAVAVLLITFSMAVIYYPVGSGSELIGTVTRPLALIPMGIYALYVFIQYQDTLDHTPTEDATDVNPLKQWAFLAASLLLILVAVEGMVRAAIGFGNRLGTPSFIWGLTVVAAGTSLPDALVSVRAARAEKSTTSLANVLGSNIFDLLIAVPAGIMIAGSVEINFGVAVPMMSVLTLATILLFAAMRTDLYLSDTESYGLLGFYALFILWLVVETLGYTQAIPK